MLHLIELMAWHPAVPEGLKGAMLMGHLLSISSEPLDGILEIKEHWRIAVCYCSVIILAWISPVYLEMVTSGYCGEKKTD